MSVEDRQISYVKNLSFEEVNILLLNKMIDHVHQISDSSVACNLEARGYHIGQFVNIISFLSNAFDANQREHQAVLDLYMIFIKMIWEYVLTKDSGVIVALLRLLDSHKKTWEQSPSSLKDPKDLHFDSLDRSLELNISV